VTQLTDHELAEVAAGAGFAGQALVLAIAVALAESGAGGSAAGVLPADAPAVDRGPAAGGGRGP
jgi:hypothetical protein